MGTVIRSFSTPRTMLRCLSILAIPLLAVLAVSEEPEGLAQATPRQKRSLHVELLPAAPVLSEAWQEVENPEFLLVREAPDKRSRSKRSPEFNMEGFREHLVKRDPGYMAWTSVTNNMDVLRGHLKEKLFVEVARRDGGGLGNIGKK